MGVIRKKLYELVFFYSRTMLTKWNHGKFEVRVDNKQIIKPFRGNPLVHKSKLILRSAFEQVSEFYFD